MKKQISMISFSVFALVLCASSYAQAVKPTIKSIGNNQMANVILSNTNFNRVLVKGDKIVSIVCPQGACEAEHSPKDKSGSFILRVASPVPFTAFMATQSGRHFSLQVTPRAEDGVTLQVNPVGSAPIAPHWEKTSSFRAMIAKMSTAMLNAQSISGFSYQAVSTENAEPALNGIVSMQLRGLWQGNKVVGVKYLVTNKTDKSLTLPSSAYYRAGVLSIAQSAQTLLPKESGYVYELRTAQ